MLTTTGYCRTCGTEDVTLRREYPSAKPACDVCFKHDVISGAIASLQRAQSALERNDPFGARLRVEDAISELCREFAFTYAAERAAQTEGAR